MPVKRSQLWAGILSPPIALSGIGVAILINHSWWRLTENAISDLGRVGLPYNWVMNVPLFLSAILAIYYAFGLLNYLDTPLSKSGIVLFILGLIFLAGIAAFPEGTDPHYYVSWGFFICGSLGFLITGLGISIEKNKRFGVFTVVLFTTEVLLVKWHFRCLTALPLRSS